MKKIETLVEDIYSLFTYDPIKMDEKEVDEYIDTFGEMLKVHIKAFLYEEPRTRGNLRLSAIGKPDRRLWYDINSKKKVDSISRSTRIKFLYGYILEEFLLLCASISGHTVTDQQKELVVEGVKGHQDAIIDGVLVDCKSASSFSFKKFKDNSLVDNDPFGYMYQVAAYAKANNLNEASFLVIDKSTGEICLLNVPSMAMENPVTRIKDLKNIVKSKDKPDRCYPVQASGQSGNMKIHNNCNFCDHKIECYSDINQGKGLRSFKYSNRIEHLVKVVKEPTVEEVTNL